MMAPTVRLAILASLTMMWHATASPHPIYPRAATIAGCNAAQRTKITTALSDAADLASLATAINFTSPAFTHYLRDEDGGNAVKTWQAVADNRKQNPVAYSFNILCASKCTGVEAASLAITDSTPQNGTIPRDMKICPLFFTHAETKNDLNSKTYAPGKRGSWCQTGQHLADFLTAGHTLLHEMTHLDAVGVKAGVPAHTDATNFTTHGTDDVDGFGDDYVRAARDFLTWAKKPGNIKPGGLVPWQNAENLAASATEWWFNRKCGFTDIDL